MKTCSVIGCNNPVWGKGMCQKHIPKKPLKKATFKYCPMPSAKSPLDKLIEDEVRKALDLPNRNDFFITIWNKRPHICQHCGKRLGNEPRSYMFDHLLEKSKYKDLEFEEENIWLVCLECHDCKTRGIISDKYREKINFVTTKFNVS